MIKKTIYETNSLYRDKFRVHGFQFGQGEKSVCIVGNLRGNEVQQIYACSQLVKILKTMEAQGENSRRAQYIGHPIHESLFHEQSGAVLAH